MTRRRATAIGFTAILLWSLLALFTVGSAPVPPFLLNALTFATGGSVGIVWALASGNLGVLARIPARVYAFGTVALFGYHALYFIALKRAPALEANLLNYLWPLLIVLFAGFLPGVRVRGGQWLGTLLGLAAAVVLVTRGSAVSIHADYLPGYAAALGAAVIWAAYSVLNRRHADVPSAAIALPCVLVAMLGAAAHAAFETTVQPGPGQWLALLGMGIGPVGAAFLLWDIGTKRGDIALLGSLSYLAPLLSTLLLVIAGQAQPHVSQAIAIALLLLGAWLSVRKPAH